jgi:ketosteroid isomerase-like protein
MAETLPGDEEQQVLAVEDAWIDAETRRDEAALRRIMDDRYTVNRSDGTTVGKEAEVVRLLGSNILSATLSERSVLVDGDTAVTFGTVNVTMPADGAGTVTSAARYTLTYVRRNGHWRALAFHASNRDPGRSLPVAARHAGPDVCTSERHP